MPMALNRNDLAKALERLKSGDWQSALEIVRYWYGQAKRAFPSEPDAEREIRALAEELRT